MRTVGVGIQLGSIVREFPIIVRSTSRLVIPDLASMFVTDEDVDDPLENVFSAVALEVVFRIDDARIELCALTTIEPLNVPECGLLYLLAHRP